MADAILWIAHNGQWIYIALLLVAAWQLFFWWRAQRRLRFTYFQVERETLIGARSRAISLLLIAVILMAAVLLSNAFIAPNLTPLLGAPPTPTLPLPTGQPSPTPTAEFVLPGLETSTPEVTGTPFPTRTPVPVQGSPGCLNPLATINSPIPGAILSGEIEILGTADVENFAFYKIEISTLGDNWLTVITNVVPVRGGSLGKWNAAAQPPGDYALRLVVINASGSGPEPCTIPITIVEPPSPTPTPP
jgi:hypothetical protein